MFRGGYGLKVFVTVIMRDAVNVMDVPVGWDWAVSRLVDQPAMPRNAMPAIDFVSNKPAAEVEVSGSEWGDLFWCIVSHPDK
jgi:hypothetical protein